MDEQHDNVIGLRFGDATCPERPEAHRLAFHNRANDHVYVHLIAVPRAVLEEYRHQHEGQDVPVLEYDSEPYLSLTAVKDIKGYEASRVILEAVEVALRKLFFETDESLSHVTWVNDGLGIVVQ